MEETRAKATLRFSLQYLLALAFLSRLPVSRLIDLLAKGRDDIEIIANDMGVLTRCLPLAGLLIGGSALLPALALSWIGAPPPVIALVLVAALLAATGALHEDGLADVADGFGGGHTRQRKLEIMRDSAVGTYGVSALFVCLLGRMLCYSLVLENANLGALFAAVIAGETLSRALMGWPWVHLPPAREDGGLSTRYGDRGQPQRSDLLFCLALGMLIALPVLVVGFGLLHAILAVMISFASVVAFTKLARAQIGGHTGDVLGASQQVASVTLLLTLASG